MLGAAQQHHVCWVQHTSPMRLGSSISPSYTHESNTLSNEDTRLSGAPSTLSPKVCAPPRSTS